MFILFTSTPKKEKTNTSVRKVKPKIKKKYSPITNEWTTRYRAIDGKKRKVSVRKRKGKTQIRRN